MGWSALNARRRSPGTTARLARARRICERYAGCLGRALRLRVFAGPGGFCSSRSSSLPLTSETPSQFRVRAALDERRIYDLQEIVELQVVILEQVLPHRAQGHSFRNLPG